MKPCSGNRGLVTLCFSWLASNDMLFLQHVSLQRFFHFVQMIHSGCTALILPRQYSMGRPQSILGSVRDDTVMPSKTAPGLPPLQGC